MRLLVLSLLALGAHAGVTKREYFVQGYAPYLDGTGAERLIAFNVPAPYFNANSEQQANLLRGASFSSSASYSNLDQQQQLLLFRAWCEQRYNTLRAELERLRAEGKQPSANMLAQYRPLELMIKTNAFEAVPGLSPEVQRARDEHLRIWNEARLQVIKAEAEQAPAQAQAFVKTTQPDQAQSAQTFEQSQSQSQTDSQLKQIVQPQNYTPLKSPPPVEETDEVKRAREEHLRRYNEALQQQSQQRPEQYVKATPIEQQSQPIQQQTPQQYIKATPYQSFDQQQQQQQQPVEETAEVKQAREEHIRKYNEVLLRQTAELEARPQTPQPAQPSTTPDITIKSQEQQINKAESQAEDERREELRLMELERQREEQRMLEERRTLEAERLALQQQEQQRIESERLEEAKRLQAEQQELQQQQLSSSSSSSSYKLIEAQPQVQQVQNGYYLRIKSGQAIPAISQPIQPGGAAYVLAENNPFLLRYVQQPLVKTFAPAQVKLGPDSSSSIAASSSSSVSSGSGSSSTYSTADIRELEKATRDHFRAHEIALEQLRLANQKDANQLPCTH